MFTVQNSIFIPIYLHYKSTIRGYNSRLIERNKFSIPKSEFRDTKKDKKQKRKARLALVVVRVFNGKLEVD